MLSLVGWLVASVKKDTKFKDVQSHYIDILLMPNTLSLTDL